MNNCGETKNKYNYYNEENSCWIIDYSKIFDRTKLTFNKNLPDEVISSFIKSILMSKLEESIYFGLDLFRTQKYKNNLLIEILCTAIEYCSYEKSIFYIFECIKNIKLCGDGSKGKSKGENESENVDESESEDENENELNFRKNEKYLIIAIKKLCLCKKTTLYCDIYNFLLNGNIKCYDKAINNWDTEDVSNFINYFIKNLEKKNIKKCLSCICVVLSLNIHKKKILILIKKIIRNISDNFFGGDNDFYNIVTKQLLFKLIKKNNYDITIKYIIGIIHSICTGIPKITKKKSKDIRYKIKSEDINDFLDIDNPIFNFSYAIPDYAIDITTNKGISLGRRNKNNEISNKDKNLLEYCNNYIIVD